MTTVALPAGAAQAALAQLYPPSPDRATWQDEARPDQLAPPGEWQLWLLRGGRGAGKTRSGAEWLADELQGDVEGDVSAIVAPTFGEARDKCVEGVSGLQRALARRGIGVRTWNRSLGELWLSSGAKVIIDEAFTGAVKVQGENLKRCWCDEIRNWRARWGIQAWDESIKFAVRVGKAQVVATSTLRPTQLVKQVLKEADVTTHMRTADNLPNLSDAFRKAVVERYAGTRLGQQELDGLLLEDVEGALWRMEWIEQHRATAEPIGYQATTVALDPSDGTDAGAEQGLCVAGLGLDNDFYILKSEGHRGTVTKWLMHALALAKEHGAIIVIEKNHGGQALVELLEQVMVNTGIRAPYRMVWASEGKRTRAEPVAMLYEAGKLREQGRVRHLGEHTVLEEQQTTWVPGEPSPDRLDALVWAITHLMGYGRPDAAGTEEEVHRYTDAPAAGVHRWH